MCWYTSSCMITGDGAPWRVSVSATCAIADENCPLSVCHSVANDLNSATPTMFNLTQHSLHMDLQI